MLTRRDMLQTGTTAAAAVALGSGATFAAAPGARTAVDFDVPRGGCDCHVHVFGDPAKFPFAAKRIYTPPQASAQDLLQLQRDLRLDRVVIVQPSVYGTDNSCTIDGIKQLGARARGVAVIDKATSRAALEEMAGAGIRGVRLNLETNTAGKFEPSAAKDVLDGVAEQIRGLNWHVQFYTRLSVVAALKEHLTQVPYPVVFDHFGGAKAALGVSQPGFDALLDLVKSGRAYVKISGAYRASEKAPDFADATPLAQALVAANADRIVWGTDWPHPNSNAGRGRPLTEITPPFPIDDGLLLNQLPKWVPDAGDPQEDPGRQSGAALRLRASADDGRFDGRRNASTSARVGAAALPPKRVHLRPAAAAAKRIAARALAPFGQRQREGAVEDVAGAERIDRRDAEHRQLAQRRARRARARRSGPSVTARNALVAWRDARKAAARSSMPVVARRPSAENTTCEAPSNSGRPHRGLSASSTTGMPRARAAAQIGSTNSGKRLSASTASAPATSAAGSRASPRRAGRRDRSRSCARRAH